MLLAFGLAAAALLIRALRRLTPGGPIVAVTTMSPNWPTRSAGAIRARTVEDPIRLIGEMEVDDGVAVWQGSVRPLEVTPVFRVPLTSADARAVLKPTDALRQDSGSRTSTIGGAVGYAIRTAAPASWPVVSCSRWSANGARLAWLPLSKGSSGSPEPVARLCVVDRVVRARGRRHWSSAAPAARGSYAAPPARLRLGRAPDASAQKWGGFTDRSDQPRSDSR
jgi:hypothetical protein